MAIAIKVEQLSKAYQLGEIGTGTISRDIERWLARIRGKEDPFLKIGEVNDRTVKSKSDVVWSLKDLDFEIKQGDAVGVVGKNGAGKSTLLKLLSRVTAPTTGSIKARGRIASLLEVGTGFHPELTGRENIYLNGSILGMRKKEIDRKLDQIIDFSGVERYVDTPVKRYSSGMYVRLAFAVAAHLDSEILIVDEVLAVGDAEFQKKCLGKMGEVSRNEGRTVLFVSHNMGSVIALCNSGMLLSNGMIEYMGDVGQVVDKYNQSFNNKKTGFAAKAKSKPVYISDFYLEDKNGKRGESIVANEFATFTIEVTSTIYLNKVHIGYGLNDMNDNRLFTLFTKFQHTTFDLQPGKNIIKCDIEKFFLKPDEYKILIFVGNEFEVLDYYEEGVALLVQPSLTLKREMPDRSQGPLLMNESWHL
jgi:lipopolysaccharide transport system ATP-binding protein